MSVLDLAQQAAMRLPAAIATGVVFIRQSLAAVEHLGQAPAAQRAPAAPNTQADSADGRQPEEESHEERARNHRDLIEWEHMEIDRYDGTATLRTVKSTAPKTLSFSEERIMSEAEEKRLEEKCTPGAARDR
ncbi:hypothetical protein LTR85_001111 [Meristemomyces frigidus]|nr:hypothetical protein LTR85_001111 [Meristemomyces frigidus]